MVFLYKRELWTKTKTISNQQQNPTAYMVFSWKNICHLIAKTNFQQQNIYQKAEQKPCDEIEENSK